MLKKTPPGTKKTPKGFETPAKSREDVLADFRKIAGPPRGRNRDHKPKT